MPAEPLRRLLRRSPELDRVRDRLEQVRQLQERYRSIAPKGLASSSRVCAVDGTAVVIRADNAPVAAALKAMAPRLLQQLLSDAPPGENSPKTERDQELTSVRVEVQVAAPPPRRIVVARGEVPVDKLAALAGQLSDSPLKDALVRITGGQRKTSTRSKR